MQSTPSLIRQIFDRAFNQGDLAIVDELLSSDHLAHNTFAGSPNGAQGLKWLIVMFRTAFPDLHCTVEDEIRAGDQVAAHWTMRGTHEALFMGNPSTGKQMQMPGILFAKLQDGMIVEYWMLMDQYFLLQQLGIIPH